MSVPHRLSHLGQLSASVAGRLFGLFAERLDLSLLLLGKVELLESALAAPTSTEAEPMHSMTAALASTEAAAARAHAFRVMIASASEAMASTALSLGRSILTMLCELRSLLVGEHALDRLLEPVALPSHGVVESVHLTVLCQDRISIGLIDLPELAELRPQLAHLLTNLTMLLASLGPKLCDGRLLLFGEVEIGHDPRSGAHAPFHAATVPATISVLLEGFLVGAHEFAFTFLARRPTHEDERSKGQHSF